MRARHAEPDDDDPRCDAADDMRGPQAFEPDTALASQQTVNAILATIDPLPLRCREEAEVGGPPVAAPLKIRRKSDRE